MFLIFFFFSVKKNEDFGFFLGARRSFSTGAKCVSFCFLGLRRRCLFHAIRHRATKLQRKNNTFVLETNRCVEFVYKQTHNGRRHTSTDGVGRAWQRWRRVVAMATQAIRRESILLSKNSWSDSLPSARRHIQWCDVSCECCSSLPLSRSPCTDTIYCYCSFSIPIPKQHFELAILWYFRPKPK